MTYLVDKLTELQKDGKTKIDLKEAAVPTGSGLNVGGEFSYHQTTTALRRANPLRIGANIMTHPGSAVRYVSKIGDQTDTSSANGPWGYALENNLGTPDTRYWSLSMQNLNTVVPIRTWFFEDLPQFSEAILNDIRLELLQREGESAAVNNDGPYTPPATQTATAVGPATVSGNGATITISIPSTAGFVVGQWARVQGNNNANINGFYRVTAITANTNVTVFYAVSPGNPTGGVTTVTAAGTSGTGGNFGLRGLDSYTDGTTWIWGANGDAPSSTGGRHTLATITQASAAAITYNELLNVHTLLPSQFWGDPTTCWQISPTKYNELRNLRDNQQLPLLLDVGEDVEGGQTNLLFGRPVIINQFLSAQYPIYLLNAGRGLQFADYGEIELSLYEQYIPGTTAIYASKRVAFSITDPSAVVRVKAF